ncbi:holo-ACP synthase [Leptospira sp. GIMC2001]|uniref:holo-ACP synthase n=1 Tax=Leptospira sp. GIMC2001 TaxID=1513297 RepID=UPI00234A6C1D|nr:holo-ACP synthase [Leptospira sp. GIMC2001]WCL48740.1 holo-ACP synthase [Leptospira sp. GIMC2001]
MKMTIGNDIIANHRIKAAWDEFGDRFLNRVFTDQEKEYCLKKKDPVPHLAARFACKEAFIKALDCGSDFRFDMREIELVGSEFGKKRLCINGKSMELFSSKGFSVSEASISHCDEYSTAVVLLY